MSPSESLRFPLSMCASKSLPHPDLATRIFDKEFPNVQPVVASGECKQSRRGITLLSSPTSRKTLQVPQVVMGTTGTGSNSSPFPLAQISASVHGTMILLVLYHYSKNGLSARERDEKKLGKLDKRSFVYSVYYDEERVIIYVQFPVLIGNRWRFFMTPVLQTRLVSITLEERFYLAFTLFVVKRHAEELVDWFKGFPWKKFECMCLHTSCRTPLLTLHCDITGPPL
jgi:hypothetical protein